MKGYADLGFVGGDEDGELVDDELADGTQWVGGHGGGCGFGTFSWGDKPG